MSNLREPCFWGRIWPLVRERRLTTWIETGTGPPPSSSLSVAYAMEMQPWSCDINKAYVEDALDRFPGSTCMVMESREFLAWACRKVSNAPTLFFLDAHFPAYPDYTNSPSEQSGAPEFPVLEELKIIRETKAGWENDVILCDDIFCIVDPANPRYRRGEVDGSAIAQTNHNWMEYVAPFLNTHHAVAWLEFEGILAFIPKEK